MAKKPIISPSIMGAKPWEVLPYVRNFEKCGIDMIHYDVIDGHFAPNIAIGTGQYAALHEVTDMPLDLHLMVTNPAVALNYFDVRPGDQVCFHPETCTSPYRLLQQIRDLGAKSGIALSIGTPISYIEEMSQMLDFVLVMAVEPGFSGQKMLPDHLQKLHRVAELVRRLGLDIDIMVDGDARAENAKLMLEAGATGIVSGSAMIKPGADPENFPELYDKYMHEIGF